MNGRFDPTLAFSSRRCFNLDRYGNTTAAATIPVLIRVAFDDLIRLVIHAAALQALRRLVRRRLFARWSKSSDARQRFLRFYANEIESVITVLLDLSRAITCTTWYQAWPRDNIYDPISKVTIVYVWYIRVCRFY